MKVAVLSDIHGNVDALKAVLEMAKTHQVDKILVLGDFVGYYYHPDKVLSELKSWDCEMIQGNHEEILKSLYTKDVSESEIIKKYGSGHKIALEKLKESELKMLFELPYFKSVQLETFKVMMCHGSNFDKDYYLYPNETNEILNRCSSNEHQFIFVGHSHYPFVRTFEGSTLVNVGSVGQSRMAGGVANWIILHTENHSIQFMNSRYDISNICKEVKEKDPSNEYLWKILERNNG
jgi:putative phosphoesterase